MLDDVQFFSNVEKMDAAYTEAKEYFGEHKPYRTVRSLSGPKVVMNKHFTTEAVLALGSGIMTPLSKEEGEFLIHFIEWQNYLLEDPENPIVAGSAEDLFESDERDALEAFNNWLVDEIAGTPHLTYA